MQKSYKLLISAAVSAVLFTVFTVCAATVGVRPAGFEGSDIGFADLNMAVFASVGENGYFDKTSDAFLGIALVTACAFAIAGAVQWIKRKKLKKVDGAILLLGALYILIIILYGVFEVAAINFRPGAAEASYPSTHVLIVTATALSAAVYASARGSDKKIKAAVWVICASAAALTALCRLCSGEHWLTDIIGGLMLGGALVLLYAGLVDLFDRRSGKEEKNGKTEK